jgi:hypothetical protein
MALGMALGIVALFGGIILGSLSVIYMFFGVNYIPIPPAYSVVILTAICSLTGIMFFIYDIMTNGVAGVFFSAKINGDPIAIILRNDKAVRFIKAELKEGLAHTKRYGNFILLPNSIYNLPNGVTGFLAYYKYGVSLPTRFIRATSRLKASGINDIEEVEKLEQNATKLGETIRIDLNARKEETNKRD